MVEDTLHPYDRVLMQADQTRTFLLFSLLFRPPFPAIYVKLHSHRHFSGMTMASNTAAPPVALHHDSVPDDLICSICMMVPAEPLITPCDHIFCQTCIHQALSDRNLCPIDRRPCTHSQLKRLEGITSRIWNGIQVKCGGHDSGCAWTGSVADYAAHTRNCIVSRAPVANNNALVEQLESTREENATLRRQLNEARNDAMTNTQMNRLRMNSIQYENSSMREELAALKRLVETLKDDKKSLKKELRHAEDEIDDLKEDRKSLKRSLRDRPDLPKLFHGSYDFRRENVVELSQLISRHLEDKPKEIDSNKIYNCVHACFTDLEKGYGDNPEHFYIDMRMLLATCLASNWFTENQSRSIEQWNKDHFC
jgi:hypothetical protein